MSFLSLDYNIDQLIGVLKKYKIVIIAGNTGSGKTTRIPQYCFLSGLNKEGIICCTQPRRLAVISAAQRTAFEMNYKLGTTVGYSVRFENMSGKNTKIKFVTDGILLREWILNPFLNSYSILIVDEVHERCIYTDLILCLCKNLLRVRPKIKIIISSATLNVEKFSSFFNNSPVFIITSKNFVVRIFFSRFKRDNFLISCYFTIIKILNKTEKKNILVFLTGKKEIDLIYSFLHFFLKKNSRYKFVEIVCIYSGVSLKIQYQILKYHKKYSKIILATNIAEISLTIPDITFVVDSGFMKQITFNPYFLMKALITTPLTKANAIQRTGRTGRTQNGKCYRLYTKWSFINEINDQLVAEIQKIDLCQIILFLKCLGINNFLSFDWIDFPSKIGLIQGFKKLYLLGAIDINGIITFLGRKIINYPVDPMLSKVIINGKKNGCAKEIILISSMIMSSFCSQNLYYYQKIYDKKITDKGDHFLLLHMFLDWKNFSKKKEIKKKVFTNNSSIILADDIDIHLSKIFNNFECSYINHIKRISFSKIMFSFLSGYFLNIAILYRTFTYNLCISNTIIVCQIHPFSMFNNNKCLPSIILFNDIILTSQVYLMLIMPLKKVFLKNLYSITFVKTFFKNCR